MRFEWDANKAETNAAKHGVTFEEASTAFEDDYADLRQDSAHPERFVLTGVSAQSRLLVVVHIEIDGDVTRIISARPATRQERKTYEEG